MVYLKKFFLSLLKFSETISVVFLILLFLTVFYEVNARSLFNKPTIWATEFVGYFLLSASFIGSSYTLKKNKHLVIDLLLLRLKKKKKLLLEFIANLISLIFCILVVLYGLKLVQISYFLGVVSVSELRIPLWIPNLIIPLSFLFLSFEFISRILKQIKFFRS
ncbi:MAG: TRAP transporter small permease subunit [Pelagibacteraceae bacterium]|nr:TRAP transporter small permease subunit [Pelagibacteraceae bacterium]